jgi:hypothetical protein
MTPNPLSDQEIRALAQSDKPYAHAFRGIPGGETR